MWESLPGSMEIGMLRTHSRSLVDPVGSRRRPHTTHSSHLEVRVGWFIAQSLTFIIIAALIGLATGIWTGWLVWGRRAKGKHTAERTEAAARATAAETAPEPATEATADAGAEKSDAEPVPALVAAAAASDSAADTATSETPDADAAAGDDTVLPVESDVVAEAEAVARKAAEADAAPAVDAPADAAPETPDDLRRIEGIGPKIASALVAAGYPTYAKIAAATEDELREAVAGQGIKFAPSASSWADQAQYLVDSDADGLEEYQDYLVGGQERRAKFDEKVDYADVDEIAGAEAKAAALAEDEADAAAAAEPEPEPEPEPQDLQRIEGIGPKIESVLKSAGYTTYAKVAAAPEAEIREALATGGIKFAPAAASWAEQAQLLADGDEEGLQEYQDYLVGGQERRAKFKENVDYTDVDEIVGAKAKAEALAEDEAKAAAEGDAEPSGSEVKA
jgi:predicted flap endonuclease-1-like 5' DNA nuclease